MDPLSIIASALPILIILQKATTTITAFINDAEVVNETSAELLSDLKGLCDLIENINLMFRIPNFTQALEDIQRESHVNLVICLDRALQSCSGETEKLESLLSDLRAVKPNGRLKRSILQLRLDQRMEEITKIRQNFQHHKSYITLTFSLFSTYDTP